MGPGKQVDRIVDKYLGRNRAAGAGFGKTNGAMAQVISLQFQANSKLLAGFYEAIEKGILK